MSISLNDMNVTRGFIQNLKHSIFENENITLGGSEFTPEESTQLMNMLEDALIERTGPLSPAPLDPSAWVSALTRASQARDYTMVGGGEFEHRELKSVLNTLKFYQNGFDNRRQLLMNVADSQDARLVDYHMQLASMMVSAYQKAQNHPSYRDMAPSNPTIEDPEFRAWDMPLLLAYQMDLSRSAMEGQQLGKWYPETFGEVSKRWSAFLDVKERQPTVLGIRLNADYVDTEMRSHDMAKLGYTFNEMLKYRDSIAGTAPFRATLSYVMDTVNNELCVDLGSRLEQVTPIDFYNLLRSMRSDRNEMFDVLPRWQGQIAAMPYGAAVGSITGLYHVEFMDDAIPNRSADLEYDELIVATSILTQYNYGRPIPVEFLGSESTILRVTQNASLDVSELRWVMEQIDRESSRLAMKNNGLSIADLLVVASKLEQIADHLSDSFNVHSRALKVNGKSMDPIVKMRLQNSVQNLKETSASIKLFTAKQYQQAPFIKGQSRITYSEQKKAVRPSDTAFLVAYDPFPRDNGIDLNERRRRFLEQTTDNAALSFRVNASLNTVFSLPHKDRIFHTLSDAQTFIESIPDELFSDLPVSKDEMFDIRKVQLSDRHLSIYQPERAPKLAALIWVLNSVTNEHKMRPLEQQLLIHANDMGIFVPESLKASIRNYSGGYSDLAYALPHALKQMDSESLSDVINSINYNGEYKQRPEVAPRLDDGEHLAVSAPKLTRR